MKKLSFLMITILLFSVLVGCGGITIPTGDGGKIKLDGDKVEFTDENGETGSISVDENSGSVSIEGSDGSTSYSAGEGLPKGWPSEIMPIIDGGNVVHGGRVEEEVDGKKYLTLNAVVEVDKSLDEITAFYNDVMEGAEELTKMKTSDMATVGGYLNDIDVFIMVQSQEVVINLYAPVK